MPADGTVTTGKDGIVAFADDDQQLSIDAATEAPMLTDWTLTTTATFNTTNTQAMLSNSDGGSGATLGWDQQEVTGKAFTMDLTIFWQKTDVGAAAKISPEKVGDQVYLVLYPNKKASGDPLYKGYARVANVSPTASTSTKVTQTVQLIGDGDLLKAAVA